MKTKLLLLLLLFLFAVSNGFAQYTSIPDTKFEAKLIALGIDDVADGQVLTSNINTLTQLLVPASYITDLTGIQDFVALTYLNCQSNNLSSLDLSINTKLKQLNCSYNKLTNLDLSKNKELYGLECFNNQLSSLDLSQNTKLAALKCNNNQLTTLNIKNGNNGGIYLLNFSYNKNISCVIVDDVSYANPKWNNQTEAYPFFSSYDCSTITQIPNTQFEDKLIALGIDTDGKNGMVLNSSIQTLTTLDISNSSLTDVTGLEGFSSLTTLNCSNNLLNNINLSGNSALTTLDCSNNPTLTCIQVADIAFATNNWTTTKDALANFNLDCNEYTLIPDTNFEAKLIALGIDNVADGKVLTSKINKLLKLEIYNSSIANLTGIQDFVALKSLNFSNNQITNVDLSKNTALTTLLCDRNQLSVLDLSNNTALDYLSCPYNKLTSLDLSKNTTIFNLYCNNNQLTNLDLRQNITLMYFDCSQNQLTTLDISNCTKLNILTCNSNKIKTLDVNLNIELYELKVQDNQITSLDLSKNTALNTLNCSSNKLTSLNLKNGTNSKLSNVNFSINPDLSCITVDDVTYANTNWTEIKDAHCFYSSYDCSAVTVIPNDLFEDKLIALGIDTDGKNGVVFNSSIQTLTALDLSNSSLTDVTGLEGFSALTTLNVSNNLLKSLNLSKNKALTTLDCSNNASLTCIQVADVAIATANWTTTKDAIANFGLDCRPYTLIPDTNFEAKLIALKIDDIADGRVLTARISTIKELQINDSPITDLTGIQDFAALVNLWCINSQITSLDLSKNIQLETLNCNYNKLTTLDLSKNTKLISLSCYSNELTNINLKNGHNSNISSLNFASNFNLSCIAVDDETYANANWSSFKDASAFYSVYNCSEITGIPDPLFEDKLIALTIDADGKNKYILNSSIQTLTTLDISNSSIANLTGIQAFTALTSLDCSTNKLETLDLNKNILLTDLNCNSNSLKKLDISGNTALTKLNISSNQLKTIDFSKNTSLTDLNCSSNLLNDLIISANTSLTKLNLSSNQLTALDISKNIALTNLIADSNQLTALDVSKNTPLTNLQTSSNQLTSLDVSKNLALTNLNVSSNQLAGLDVSNNSNLSELILSSNPLLKNLNLKNGNNSKLSEATISFTDNPNLKCIQVDDKVYSDTNWAAKKDATASYNEDCDPFTAISDANFEDKLIALGIDTDGKNGKVLIESINTITTLDVSSSTIADLTGIQKFEALTSLNCSSNQIITLDVSKNKALVDLNCSSNSLTSLNCKNGNNSQMTSFNAKNNPNLTCIQVDDAIYANTNWATKKDAIANFNTDCATANLYTYIPDLNFENKLIALTIDSTPADGKVLTSSINTLTSLNVSDATISNLTGIDAFSALTNLECNGNQLTSLDISKNTTLTDLNCSTNQLATLDVSGLISLAKLNVSSNQLTTLDISKNIALTNLIADSNKLTALDVSKNTALTDFSCKNNVITSLDFTSNTELSVLDCSNNALTELKVDKNTKLATLISKSNQLSALNINNNTALTLLDFSSNQLTSIDLTKNKDLTQLFCASNQLPSLNITENTALTELNCSSNQLTSLNLKNGNNANFNSSVLHLENNPNLSCIKVDDKTYSDTNWTALKDATASYDNDCGISLPSTNFIVQTKGESCLGENNGEINISATETFLYTASINGQIYPFTNNTLTVTNLSPGDYTVSISIPGETLEQNFNLVIAKGTSITGKSSVSSKKVNVEITDGTAPYTVFVNGVEQFETSASNFSLTAKGGGLLEVKTAKACEGIYTEDITGLDLVVSAYPNPTSGSFEIELPVADKEVTIEINALDGRLISSQKYSLENGTAQLTLENQPKGVYIAKIHLGTVKNIKIIKN